jgi:hypothetical protein
MARSSPGGVPNVIAPTVTLRERHVRQQHDRVQDLVEVAGDGLDGTIVGPHPPAAVDKQHDALIVLVLEMADKRFADPERRASM